MADPTQFTLTSGPLCPWCGEQANDQPGQIMFSPVPGDAVETRCESCAQPIVIRCVADGDYIALKEQEWP